ncbi:uncharacterized protein LOC135222773 [Macrobrachium nipponense]|uniref:uncharacterized protein LOC135222773 n=1 Tax=Macrobrachium nipponense TaxID=159736 RepID=UPI0030C87D32
MRGEKIKEQESESDWDSMSEMEPPPKEAVRVKASQSSSQGQAAAVPRKLKSLTFVDPESGKGGGEKPPPFDFKSETPADTKEEMPIKPGKARKGNIYNPNEAKQRHVSFAEGLESSRGSSEMNGRDTGGVTDSEDPLYATVNHKLPNMKRKSPTSDSEDQSFEKLTREERRKKALIPENTGRSLQGLENKGYVDDEESFPSGKPSKSSILRNKRKNPPKLPVQESSLVLPENETVLTSKIAGTESVEGLQPLILSLGQTSIEAAGKKPIDAMNKAISEACTFLTFPVFFFSLLLHHVIRFFLQGLIKPLVVDSLVLVVEYLVRPCLGLVVKPVLFSLHGASSAFSDIVLVCLRPVTVILQSVRLIEIHYTRRYSVEDV